MKKLLVAGCWLLAASAVAADYGTLNAQTNLVRAPYAVRTPEGTAVTASLSERQANALGYKLVEDVRPQCASNEYAVAVGWAETNRIYRVYERRTVVPAPRKFSKLKIYAAISGLCAANSSATWAKVQAWLEGKTVNGMNGWLAFQLAQEVSEDHPLFAAWSEEARVLLGLTPAQFETLLNACILEE